MLPLPDKRSPPPLLVLLSAGVLCVQSGLSLRIFSGIEKPIDSAKNVHPPKSSPLPDYRNLSAVWKKEE
ncbi:UNVERIFIED_CONTAM: hypothetical protein K2H54_057333 [Gekko kuhli]